MKKPNQPVSISYSPAGCIVDESEMDVRTIVVGDENDVPVGLLEWWGSGCWIYADTESLHPVEPEQ